MNNLKILRKNLKLTQNEVAKSLKIPVFTYRNYENGLREPNVEMLKKLAKFFNTSIDNLLDYSLSYISDERKKLNKLSNLLTDDECKKMSNFAEGLILSREVETKKKIFDIENEN